MAGEDVDGAAELVPLEVALEQPGALPTVHFEPLRSADVGVRLIRGGAVRAAGYGLGMVLTAIASIFLLRYLGVANFGHYITVVSLIAIVSGVTDAGLGAVGGRDAALRPPGEERRKLLANLLGLRLVLTPLGVIGATAFAIAAGYGRTLVLGTLFAGVGLVLTSCQATMTLPLYVELRMGRLAATEILKQAVMLVSIAVLVAAGAGVLPFFGVFIVVGLAALAFTRPLVGRGLVWRPAFDRAEWRMLTREAIPLAAALVMNIVYFRLLIVLMSILAAEIATGLFATSFRVLEILYGISALVATVALPVLALAAQERARLQYMLQRMIEVSAIAACYAVIIVMIVAGPVLEILGGSQYRDAAPVLRIQVFALIPMFLSQVLQVGFIAIRRQSAQVVASGIALVLLLVLGLALIPLYDATGAAVAAVIAEAGLAIALLVLLIRCDPLLRPTAGFVWKVAIACGLGSTAVLIPGLPSLAAAAIATVLYAAGLWATGAIPPELLDAIVRRGSP